MSIYETIDGTITFPLTAISTFRKTVLYKEYIKGDGECNKDGFGVDYDGNKVVWLFNVFWIRNYKDLEADLASLVKFDSKTEIGLFVIYTDGTHKVTAYFTEGGLLLSKNIDQAPREVVTEEV